MKDIKKISKVSLKWLFFGIMFLGLLGVLVYCAYRNSHDKVYMPLYEFNEEGYAAKIDVDAFPFCFGEFEDNDNKVCFVTDDKQYIYIVHMSNDTYNTIISTDDIESNNITLYGKSVKIYENVKEIAITAYNKITEDEKLSKKNFNDYFGNNMLDTVNVDNIKYHKYVSNAAINIMCILVFLAAVGSVLIFVLNTRKNKRFIASLDDKKLKKIENEIKSKTCEDYSKNKLYLTDNYIIDFSLFLDVIKYSDVLWVYKYEKKSYIFFVTKRSIIIIDKDKKRHEVASSFRVYKDLDKYDKVYDHIVKKCPKAIHGYTDDNVEEFNNKK